MKHILRLVIGLTVGLLLVVAMALGPYALRVQHFAADPAAGYHADFFLYLPPQVERAALNGRIVAILVQPNNSGTNSDDPVFHRRDAWLTGFERHKIANELGVILLVPAFIRPGEDWFIYTHALDRDSLTTQRADLQRIDLQLLAMLDHARFKLTEAGIQTDEKILIQGFSASGMFANRFTILHPDRVKAATIGSPGGFPFLPVTIFNGEQLTYPAGIADLEILTGAPFDSAEYNSVPQLIYMGALDDSDSLDFTDGWDEAAARQVDRLFGVDPISRWGHVMEIYTQGGHKLRFFKGGKAQFVTVGIISTGWCQRPISAH